MPDTRTCSQCKAVVKGNGWHLSQHISRKHPSASPSKAQNQSNAMTVALKKHSSGYKPTRCKYCGYDIKGMYGSDRSAHREGWCTNL